MKTKLKKISFFIIGALLVLGGTLLAGSLSPTMDTSTPSHLYTLEDIYQRLGNLNYTPSVHTVSTTSSPIGTTMHDLTEIWNNFPTISANTIATGTTVMGVTGTMYGASSPDYVLTTAGIGAGDVVLPAEADVRAGTNFGANNSATGTMSAGTPALVWQVDQGITLCWDTDPNGVWNTWGYCSIENGWTAEGYGAKEYCASLGAGWRLPTEAELMSALAQQFTPGGTGGPSSGGFQGNAGYWSSSEDGDGSAWYGVDSFGYLSDYSDGKSNQSSVRCVL